MTPNRNQPDSTQTGRDSDASNAPKNNPNSSQQYRPDWIILDNTSSKKTNELEKDTRSGTKDNNETSDTSVNTDDTLGIP